MKRLELTTDLLTGIADIDDQHRELFIKGNSILFPGGGAPSTREFAEVLVFLIRYVDYHFLAEEDAMERYGFDRSKGHKRQHHRLREDIKDLYKHAKQEGATKNIRIKLHFMLSDWFTYHIKHSDRAFAGFLREQNSLESVSLKEYDELRKLGITIDELWGDTDNASVEFIKTRGIDNGG